MQAAIPLYPDIRIARDEVKAIWKSPAGELVVKTGDWKKLKFPAASCRESRFLRLEHHRIRSLTPLQAAGNALTPEFISIPPSLIGLAEVEGLLSQWRPIKPYPRAKIFLSYSLAFLAPVAVIIAFRGYHGSHALRLPYIVGAVLVIMIANLFLLRMLRRFPNMDERSRPKRWQFYMTIVYILLFVISLAVFFGLKK